MSAQAPAATDSGRLHFADEKDVDQFLSMLTRFEKGEIDADEWRAFRLVNGVYGQRQDDVMMIRIKIPQGILNPAQLRAVADVAETYTNGKGHVTTRQNIQLHFVKVADAEKGLRQLGDVGLTTREACGNAVRNITCTPWAGVLATEPFDPTPYAQAVTRHLLRGPWSSSLPRKFKIAFGGSTGHDDIQASINDLGLLTRIDDQGRRGFKVYMGGGLATLRRVGVVAHEFLPEAELLECAEAIVRVFHRIGNRKDKHKARLKWAIQKLGVEAFLAEYRKERELVRAEGGRPYALPEIPAAPALPPAPTTLPEALEGFDEWRRTNVRAQKQEGFSAVTVRLVLGDATSAQLRSIAELITVYSEGELRTTNEQNLVLRFVPTWKLPALHRELVTIGLGGAGANTVADVTSCPGAMSCKLAVTQSRGLATLLNETFASKPELAAKAPTLDIKMSGCPNGCGQHHISGIGFQGALRKVGGKAVPQYFVMLGGGITDGGAQFGRLATKIPARRVPAAVERLIELYTAEKAEGEEPADFFQRVPLDKVQGLLKDLAEMELVDAKPEDFIDLGEDKAFEVTLMEGECAA